MFLYLRLLAGNSHLKWNASLQYIGHLGEGVSKGLIYGVYMSIFDFNFMKSSPIRSIDQYHIKLNYCIM